jgi:pilus assembly protein FimV
LHTKTQWFTKLILLVGVCLSSSVWCLTLGNIQVLSNGSVPFNAKIAFLGNEQELRQLSQLKVNFPAREVYEQYGLKQPTDIDNFSLSIERTSNQLPTVILVKTDQAIPLEELFNEILIEVSWTGGKLIRVYTILNSNKTPVTVNPGDNLSRITQSLMPELPQASFEQALTAIFRLNPKAFIAGNIHRLKVGAQLEIPSQSMIESIPIDEAKTFSSNAQENFQLKLWKEPSEKIIDSSGSTGQDRLLLSSSEAVSDKALLETKLEEELIAQKKVIEQAQIRITEIKKNIADLKKQSDSSSYWDKISTFFSSHTNAFWELLAVFGLFVVFVYGNFFRQGNSHLMRQSPLSNSAQEIPGFAKNIFQTLDLNLDSPLSSSTSTPLNSFKNEDHGIAINNAKPHRNIPSISDQKLRLNLAKSYIKIHDYPTAKILLQEIVGLGSDGSSDVVREAKKYLLQIA